MIEALDQAIYDRLVPITLPDKYRVEQRVPVSVGKPEEWLGEKRVPSINLWRLEPEFDAFRYRPTEIRKWYADDSKSNLIVGGRLMPYTIYYQIDFLTSFMTDYNLLLFRIHAALPPFGFGTMLTIKDRFGHDVQITWEETDSRNLTPLVESGDRTFRHALTYAFDAWLEPNEEPPSIVRTVKTVTTDVIPVTISSKAWHEEQEDAE